MKIWLLLLLALIVGYISFSNCKSSKYMKQHKKAPSQTKQRFENDFLPTLKLKRVHREPPDVEHAYHEEHRDRHISLPDFHDESHVEVFGHVYTHDGDLVGASKSELGYDVEDCHVCRHHAEEYFHQEGEGSGVHDYGDYYDHEYMGDDIDYYFEVRGRGGGERDVEDYVLLEDEDQDCCSCNCQRRHTHKPPCKRDQDGSC
ncbi:uncharacterized protein LOC106078418 [Biomphalaria glabrata]|uniref:Uncharacterized protein LOC106078418 n=1 Tax=Biomphalaria glabrata TaxID=6526 RepID=A0A9W2YQH5_BIOGL|nr:uncharacterized protein LOC106078418 [Biomphalaria glabrata]